MRVLREIKEWVPMGHTLTARDDMVRDQFKWEHPNHRGEIRLTAGADGFWKIEFRGVVVVSP